MLGVTTVRIDLSRRVLESAGEAPYPLEAGGRTVGTLYTPEDEEIAPAVQRRLLPALASLLGVTAERERLARRQRTQTR